MVRFCDGNRVVGVASYLVCNLKINGVTLMKIKVGDTWRVAVGMGVTVYAKTYEEACALERSSVTAMKWGIVLGILIPIVVIALVAC